MKTLKKLAAAVVLMCVLALSALADDPVTPPCVPGDINTPPCAMAQAPDPDMATLGTTTDETSLTEIATNVVLGIVSLF